MERQRSIWPLSKLYLQRDSSQELKSIHTNFTVMIIICSKNTNEYNAALGNAWKKDN